MDAEKVLLTFVVPRSEKELVVDILLDREDLPGFTVTDSQGFSREHSEYSLEEQVAGYRGVSRFEVVSERATNSKLLRALEQGLSREPIYWTLPLLDSSTTHHY